MKIDFDGKGIDAAVKKLSGNIAKRRWIPVKRFSEDVLREIKRRTLNVKSGTTGGIDYEAGHIRDNTTATIKQKQRKGRTHKGRVTSLYDTGEMIDGITIKTNKTTAESVISLPGSRKEIAGWLAEYKGYDEWFKTPLTIHNQPSDQVFRNRIKAWLKLMMPKAV